MKIYIQWATNPASGWVQYDHKDWPNLPFKPVPVGGEILDDKPGWIFSLNVQGVIFGGDHISMWEKDGKLCVKLINNDPEDFEAEDMLSVEYIFDTLFSDPSFGGLINTRQSGKSQKGFDNSLAFQFPENAVIGHGIWLDPELYNVHNNFYAKDWQDWIGDSF